MRARRIDVIQPGMRIDSPRLQNSIAVVIDILRASTTIVTAFANGCREIIPVPEIEDARQILASRPQESMLLCGERSARIIEGFDLGNSPLEYSAERVRGRTLVLTTSNGTRALVRAGEAKKILVLSFLNFQMVCYLLRERTEDVFVFCSGSGGRESLEDSVCAGMLAEQMQITLEDRVELNNAAKNAMELARKHQTNLLVMLKTCKHGSFLMNEGFADDLDICARLNTRSVIPVFEDGLIQKKYKNPLYAESTIGKTLMSK